MCAGDRSRSSEQIGSRVLILFMLEVWRRSIRDGRIAVYLRWYRRPLLSNRHQLYHSRVRVLLLPFVVGLRLAFPRAEHILTQRGLHCGTIGEVSEKSRIEVSVLRLQICVQATVLHGKMVIILFVYLIVGDDGLRDSVGASSTLLVDFRCALRRLYSRFKAPVTSTGCRDECPIMVISASCAMYCER